MSNVKDKVYEYLRSRNEGLTFREIKLMYNEMTDEDKERAVQAARRLEKG